MSTARDFTEAEFQAACKRHGTERTRERDRYSAIINRALDELLELHVRGGGNVLGDFLDDNSELMLADVCEQIPTLLDAYNRDLIFRAIEILNEINER